MKTDILLMAILFVGVILLNKEYIMKEWQNPRSGDK